MLIDQQDKYAMTKLRNKQEHKDLCIENFSMKLEQLPSFLFRTSLMMFGSFIFIVVLDGNSSAFDPRLTLKTGVPSVRPKAIKSVAASSLSSGPEYRIKPGRIQILRYIDMQRHLVHKTIPVNLELYPNMTGF